MNAVKIVVRLVLAWIALLAAQIVVGMVVHPKTPANPHPMLFLAVSNAFIALALGWAALRSDWRGWKLLGALFFARAVVEFANWIEGALYLPNVGIEWSGFIVYELLTAAVAAVLWLLVFRGAPVPEPANDHPIPHRAFPQMLWRFVLCSAVYVFLYFLAGTIIFPFVRDYYATQYIPSPSQIISLQFLLRGPLFILVCLTFLRMFRMPELPGALAVGLAFTFISGVAALIMPNGIFPDTVRWAHFWEVSTSNLVFGFVVAWLWGQTQRVRKLAHAVAV
jgi:hypothetical protein